jgi:hypothetical protein
MDGGVAQAIAQGLPKARQPFPFQQGHQAHRSKRSIGIPMNVANDAFLDEAAFHVGPVGPLVALEHEEFDAMSRQVIETDLQNRSQQARSDTAPSVLHGYALEP